MTASALVAAAVRVSLHSSCHGTILAATRVRCASHSVSRSARRCDLVRLIFAHRRDASAAAAGQWRAARRCVQAHDAASPPLDRDRHFYDRGRCPRDGPAGVLASCDGSLGLGDSGQVDAVDLSRIPGRNIRAATANCRAAASRRVAAGGSPRPALAQQCHVARARGADTHRVGAAGRRRRYARPAGQACVETHATSLTTQTSTTLPSCSCRPATGHRPRRCC